MYIAAIPTPTHSRATLTTEISDWLSRMTPGAQSDVARYAVTLTFDLDKMRRKCRTNILEKSDALTFAIRNFKSFRWNLDRLILKNAATRHGRELSYVPVIEGQGAGKQIHYHCVIVTPARVPVSEMVTLVKQAWMRTEFAGPQVDVQPMRDDGWLTCMSNEAWTLRRDVVDIDNVRLSTCPKRC